MSPQLRPLTRVVLLALLLAPLALALPDVGRSEVERAVRAAPLPEHVAAATASAGDTEAVTTGPEPTAGPVSADGAEESDAAAAPAATPATPLPRPVLGWAINCHHISNLPLYLESVDGIAALGVNTLVVVTPMFQRHVDSDDIRFLRDRCPSDEQLEAILERGRQHGLFTVLMPIVLIEKPEPKEWRGVIRPDDWDAWWHSYAAMLDRFVALAVRADVDMLSIGSELNTTEDQPERWAGLIAHVRERFDGLLTYSSNWDRYDKVSMWPLVDVMAVSSYFELERDRPGAPVERLVDAWAPVRSDLVARARTLGRPLLLSELGYPSLPWANAHPWNYVAKGASADHAAQARSWDAFFRAWTPELSDPASPIAGFCGYRWDPYHAGGDDDTGYGLLGKPSHEIVRRGIGGIRAASAAGD